MAPEQPTLGSVPITAGVGAGVDGPQDSVAVQLPSIETSTELQPAVTNDTTSVVVQEVVGLVWVKNSETTEHVAEAASK